MAKVNQTNTGIEVSYPTRYDQHVVTRAEYDLINSLGNEHKVFMTKFVKNQYCIGLYEAKQIVDTIVSLPCI